MVQEMHRWHVWQNEAKYQNYCFLKKNEFMFFCGQSIGLLDGESELMTIKSPFQIDILLVSGTPKYRLEDVLRIFKFKHLVLDTSVPVWVMKEWRKESIKYGIDPHLVAENGAWVFFIDDP